MSRGPTMYEYGGAQGRVAYGSLLGKTLFLLAVLFGVAMVGMAVAPAVPIGSTVAWLLDLGILLALGFMGARNLQLATLLAVAFAFLDGVVIAPAVAYYMNVNPQAVESALLSTVIGFAAAGVVAFATRINAAKLYPILFVGLIGILVAMVLAMFLPSVGLVVASPAFNLVGVALFLGFALFDFWRIRAQAGLYADENVAAVFMAVSLLIDFVNLFLFFLRFFGGSGSRSR